MAILKLRQQWMYRIHGIGRIKRPVEPRPQSPESGEPSDPKKAKESKLPVSPSAPIQYPSKSQISNALHEDYLYQPLDDTKDDLRLITVNFSHDHEGYLNCNFEQVAMGELVGNHTYEAISYSWGSPSLVEKVLCSDCTSHLGVTQSLMDVLEKLVSISPKTTGRRQYWIDGLCINQKNPTERSAQVQKMATIYRRAQYVRIFLGNFGSEQESILGSRWFTRRWVIQEAVAAQQVIIHYKQNGLWKEVTGWEALMSESIRAAPTVNSDTQLQAAESFLWNLFDTTKTRWSGIFSLLLKFHANECGDDRDRIFSLLGVSNDVEPKDQPEQVPIYMAQFQALKIWFKPDYLLNTEQVYSKFALAAIRSPFAFDLLHCAGAFRNLRSATPRTLPTWVPDWRCPLLYKPLMRPSKCHAGILKASGKERADKRTVFVDDSNISITIKGIHISTVQEVVSHFLEAHQAQHTNFLDVDWIRDAIDLRANRAHVKLANGWEAFVPIDVNINDEVVIFVGARTPFVLRQTGNVEEGTITHELVGDCYAYGDGVMNGELINRAAKESFIEFSIV